MPNLSGSLTEKMSPAEHAARVLRIAAREKREREEADRETGEANFRDIWAKEINFQRDTFRKDGAFKQTEYNTPDGDKFYFKYSYYGVEIDLHWKITWDKKKAKATIKSWTNP